MYPLRVRLMVPTERLLKASWIALLVGATLAFGGAVWWGRLFMGGLTAVIVLTWLVRVAIEGRFRVLKSPVPVLAGMVILLGMAQLVSLPAAISTRLSPRANEAYRLGIIPQLVAADDPKATLPRPPRSGRRSRSTARRRSAGSSGRSPAWRSSWWRRTTPTGSNGPT